MKSTIISIFVAVVLVGGVVLLTKDKPQSGVATETAGNNVTIVNGKQIIEIKAKGGYLPRISTAKANMPTVLRFDTNGTFDCSSTVRVPSMNISKTLPQTGSTDIAIGAQPVGTFSGTCGMGMYPFEIDFQG